MSKKKSEKGMEKDTRRLLDSFREPQMFSWHSVKYGRKDGKRVKYVMSDGEWLEVEMKEETK